MTPQEAKIYVEEFLKKNAETYGREIILLALLGEYVCYSDITEEQAIEAAAKMIEIDKQMDWNIQ